MSFPIHKLVVGDRTYEVGDIIRVEGTDLVGEIVALRNEEYLGYWATIKTTLGTILRIQTNRLLK